MEANIYKHGAWMHVAVEEEAEQQGERMEKEIRGHLLHPSCTLVLNADGGAFNCGACKRTSSHAVRYKCGSSCGSGGGGGESSDFHGRCVMAPESLSFWGHPHHPLTLVRSGPDLAGAIKSARPEAAEALAASSPAGDGRIPVYCDMCTNEVEGMHYQCAPCGVLVHPVCVQLPMAVRSAAHPEHELTLNCSWPSMCQACGTPSTWAYQCFFCIRRFHANCVPEYHHWLGHPYSGRGDSDAGPDRARRFGGMNPLGLMDPFTMPRRGPSTELSVRPDPCGGAFPFSGEYGRSTFF